MTNTAPETTTNTSPKAPAKGSTSLQAGEIKARYALSYPASNFELDVNIAIPGTGITAIFGHSGSGKTTLLRCIAGLERAEQSQLIVKGTHWDGPRPLPTHKRPLGYVFQEASLFDHLTVQGNLNFAIKRASQAVSDDYYQEVIEVLAIGQLLGQSCLSLSGGERQRVAIARALLVRPEVLLMDEPLAALDYQRKQEIMPFLEQLRVRFNIPILYVSHAINEVSRLADHVIVMSEGKVVNEGKPASVLSSLNLPLASPEELGVIIDAKVTEHDEQWHLSRVSFNQGTLWLREGGDQLGDTLRVRILARDVSLALQPQEDSSILNRMAVSVREVISTSDPAMALVKVQAGETEILARLTQRSVAQLNLKPGMHVWAQIKSVAVVR